MSYATLLRVLSVVVGIVCLPLAIYAQGGECAGGLCGTPNQSGGAPCVGGNCAGGCGCGSILVAMTDRGDTYQFADDFDGDGIEDEFDNCPFISNYEQTDGDGDVVGDACDVCAMAMDPLQGDIDADRLGDACDTDIDGDQVANELDNCPGIPNRDQLNNDSDPFTADGLGAVSGGGDACDPDDDNDGIPDLSDSCRLLAGTATGVACDDDPDGDGVPTAEDSCPYIYSPTGTGGMQADVNQDGFGDACDFDTDGDLVPNNRDNYPMIANPSQFDMDHDGLGDASNWTGGAESCDTKECYIIGGDRANCLDPNAAFSIYLTLIGDRIGDRFIAGSEITVALFSNRFGQLHAWTTRFEDVPGDSSVTFLNAEGAAATLDGSPQVANCLQVDSTGACARLNNIRFTPDVAGRYVIRVRAELPSGDGMGQSVATYSVIAEVEGNAQGGCAATSAAGMSLLAAAAMGLTLALRTRRAK